MPPIFNPNPDRAARPRAPLPPAPAGIDFDVNLDQSPAATAAPPILSSVAARVLAQPGAASAAERNWSIYGQIHSSQKARMHHDTADKLVYCHETMHVLGKLQDAGWQADVERWETDEDSDGSDSEAALDLSEAEVLRLMA